MLHLQGIDQLLWSEGFEPTLYGMITYTMVFATFIPNGLQVWIIWIVPDVCIHVIY